MSEPTNSPISQVPPSNSSISISHPTNSTDVPSMDSENGKKKEEEEEEEDEGEDEDEDEDKDEDEDENENENENENRNENENEKEEKEIAPPNPISNHSFAPSSVPPPSSSESEEAILKYYRKYPSFFERHILERFKSLDQKEEKDKALVSEWNTLDEDNKFRTDKIVAAKKTVEEAEKALKRMMSEHEPIIKANKARMDLLHEERTKLQAAITKDQEGLGFRSSKEQLAEMTQDGKSEGNRMSIVEGVVRNPVSPIDGANRNQSRRKGRRIDTETDQIHENPLQKKARANPIADSEMPENEVMEEEKSTERKKMRLDSEQKKERFKRLLGILRENYNIFMSKDEIALQYKGKYSDYYSSWKAEKNYQSSKHESIHAEWRKHICGRMECDDFKQLAITLYPDFELSQRKDKDEKKRERLCFSLHKKGVEVKD